MTAKGDSFANFYGEFLISPIPLELSLNYCSHSCPFCFSNLNSQVRHDRKGTPLRFANTKAIENLIRDRHKRKSLESFWLREKYPVLISNRVDPFANSNYKLAVPIMRRLTEEDIPVTIQTRGGKGVDEVLEFLPKSVWYISIDHSDDTTRQLYAPANPSIESRYLLIEKLIAHGHEVVIAINPLTVEWVPEPAKILQRCKDMGVWGAWIETLHFNRDQGAIARKIGQMPVTMIKRYSKDTDSAVFQHWMHTRQLAQEIGLEVYSIGQSTYSRYWDVFKRVYPKLLPTMQDWVNHCIEQGWDSDRPISFTEFADFFAPQFPAGTFRLGHYIGAVAHQIPRETAGWSNWMDFRELLRWSWSDPRLKWCPALSPALAYIGGNSDDEANPKETLLRDADGTPYMAFWRKYQNFTMETI